MRIQKIFCDPGHGGTDPGAVNARLNLKESDLTLAIAKEFEARAIATGYEIAMARRSDDYVSLEARVALAEKFGADLFLSFHINAAENAAAHGYEVWTSIGETAADPIAKAILDQLQKEMPDAVNRGAKESNFYVLRNTTMPAVLIEAGFISNDKEALWLCEKSTWDMIAKATLSAIGERRIS